ncbi:MAG: DUF3592 domain-containing protein [Phycisphaerae bacterium]|nr:DUF3592 domain-containing protein [Phycisphaerae bacterium]
MFWFRQTRERVFGLLCLAIFAFVVSTCWLYVRWRWMSTHPSAPGVVVEHLPQGGGLFAEGIDYNAADGRVNRMLGERTKEPLPVGTKVTVRYDPENPRDGVIEMSGKTYAPILMTMFASGASAFMFGARLRKMEDD